MILLSGLVAACEDPPEYRILGRMAGLQSGTILVVRGVVVGDVPRVEHRGDTTFARVNISRTAGPLRTGDAVRTRRVGLGQLVLEVVPAPSAGRALPPGAWLQLAPSVRDVPNDPPLRHRELEPREQPAQPYQLLPPGPPPRRARDVAVSLAV